MILVSKEAEPRLIEYLKTLDEVKPVGPIANVGKGIACHPDVLYCRLGGGEKAEVFKGDETKLGEIYPADCRYNAVVVGKYIIHKQGVTDEDLLKAASRELIDVPQGYTKCNVVVVDDEHIITSDEGIAKAVSGRLDCLLISPGQIRLPGFKYGFIGGCSGRVDNQIIFNGNLSEHSDSGKIIEFINKRGLEVKYFTDWSLMDIGSIIKED